MWAPNMFEYQCFMPKFMRLDFNCCSVNDKRVIKLYETGINQLLATLTVYGFLGKEYFAVEIFYMLTAV